MERKYELTDETKEVDGVTLHRIRAVRDFGNVKAGYLGGWIEKEANLSHDGGCWVAGEGKVFGDGSVFGNGQVWGKGTVRHNGKVYDNGEVSGKGSVFGNSRVFENGHVSGDNMATWNAKVSGSGGVFDSIPEKKQSKIKKLKTETQALLKRIDKIEKENTLHAARLDNMDKYILYFAKAIDAARRSGAFFEWVRQLGTIELPNSPVLDVPDNPEQIIPDNAQNSPDRDPVGE